MDLRQLEMFLAIVEEGGFNKAAKKLYVAQSAVSRKIAILEEELGAKIFRRVNQRLHLSPAGETLLRYARRIFQDLRNVSVEVSEIAQLRRGEIKIGAGLIACIYLLPPVLEKFKDLYPQVDLTIVTCGSTESAIHQLRDNTIELGVLTLPIQFPDLEVIHLCSEEMVVVTSNKHPELAGKKSIRAVDLGNYPLILFHKGAYTRRLLDNFFQAKGIKPRIRMEAENVAIIKSLVKINLGISIIPLPAATEEVKRNELNCLRIRDYKLVRKVGLVFQKSDHIPKILSELIRLFTEGGRTGAVRG